MARTDMKDDGRAALGAALLRQGVELSEGRQRELLEYLRLLLEKNGSVNLTRIDDPDDAIVLHLEDSLAVLPEFSHGSGRFCDIGTGGGVPGVPLSIATGRRGTLLDSVKKKARAVAEIVGALGLSRQLDVRGMRSEELALEEGPAFETVVARAVSSFAAVEELATPLLVPGGRIIAMRGTESDEELEHARRAAEKLGLELVSEREFTIGPQGFRRSVYVLARTGEPSVSLPRRPGMAQKRPLR